MYKNQLQELAQRSCFNLPSYSCIREGPDHAPRFKATVNFNGETFESPSFCSTLRQAEHAAAEVALNTLASRGPSRALAARVLDETGVYKNLLQETAHRAGLKLPVYTTVRSGPGHVPVFSCTVELGGMSFTGEQARTKKQAQKNAAMAAWSALKRLVQHGTSSSSLSTSIDTKKGGEEQEQVIIARVLASLLPSELKNSKQNDCPMGQDRVIPFYKGLLSPTPSLYPVQCQSWGYPGFPPEMAIYQMWQQEQLFHLQNHILTLQLPPTPPPGPQILPYMQSIFPPDSHLFGPMMEQERIPVGPRITVSNSVPSIYLSDRVVSDPISGKSTVTIQEIHEEKPEESHHSLTVVSDIPSMGNFNTESRLEEPIDDDDKQKNGELRCTVEDVLPGENRAHQFEWASCRSPDSGFKPADFGAQNPHGLDPRQSSSHHPPTQASSSTIRPIPSVAPPVMIRTFGAVSSSAAPSSPSRNIGYVSSLQQAQDVRGQTHGPIRMRTGGPSSSGRSVPQRMNFGVVHPRFMAPAVRIRSVVPVCSAPPARKMPTSSQEGDLPMGVKNHTVSENATTASSELGKLHL